MGNWFKRWKIFAVFWILNSDESYQDKKNALESIEKDIKWKDRANRGMNSKNAVNTHFREEDES